jgi:hypothetical protein
VRADRRIILLRPDVADLSVRLFHSAGRLALDPPDRAAKRGESDGAGLPRGLSRREVSGIAAARIFLVEHFECAVFVL